MLVKRVIVKLVGARGGLELRGGRFQLVRGGGACELSRELIR